jgi:hypothetical protein
VVLGEIGGGHAEKSVREFCTLWATLPPIGYDTVVDANGTRKVASSQLSEACSRALRCDPRAENNGGERRRDVR